MLHSNHGDVWSHRTKRFRVALEVEPCDVSPSDHFDDKEDIAAIHNGDVEWFNASVIVYLDGREVARDVLGCCAYRTVAEFYTSHRDPDPLNRNCSIMRAARGDNVVICHYFPDMVREAVRYARENLSVIKQIHIRAA